MLKDIRPVEDCPMDRHNLKVYSEAEIPARLAELHLEGWYLEDGWLRRKFNTDNWPTTLMLVNAIGFLCEAADHHADLSVTYAKLWVKLKTHSAGGITDRDFSLARKIDEVALWRPEPGAALTGTSRPFVHVKK
jgi:4a-hydroxytetrahydrobiopterin dehydratase